MRIVTLAGACALAATPLLAHAADGEVSVTRGEQVSIVGGCHDCHTLNYNETSGQIDPKLALLGTGLGWQGPWGTTYPMNLRITAADKSEDEFLKYAKEFEARPPMPYYNVHAMDERDIRSLYQYIKSLGEPGEQVPEALPPGETPKTPYIVAAPPIMP